MKLFCSVLKMNTLTSFCLFTFIGYWIASIAEWAIHRYCMHASHNDVVPGKALKDINKQHLIHHAATNDDMSVAPVSKTNKSYQKHNLPPKYMKYQGLYFVWPVNIAIAVAFFVGAPIVNLILQVLLTRFDYNVSYITAIFIGQTMSAYMSIMWNYVHPTLHFAPKLQWHEGLDLLPRNECMKDTWWYGFLWRNHVLHHLLVGTNAGNFNVTLPGADWLLGTYHTECDGYKVDVKIKKIYKLK
eukprot:64520_1